MADPLSVECPDCAMPAGTTCSVGAIFRNGESPEPDAPVPSHANRQRLADLRALDHGVCGLCSRPMVRGSVEGAPIDAWHPDETDAAACPDLGDPKTDWDRYATNLNLGVLPGHPGVEHFVESPITVTYGVNTDTGLTRSDVEAIVATTDGSPTEVAAAIGQAVADRAAPPLLCPECAQGKHLNCALQALDPVTDELVACACNDDAHRTGATS